MNECKWCKGTGFVEEGEFDNHITVKCLCKVEADKDNEAQNEDFKDHDLQ